VQLCIRYFYSREAILEGNRVSIKLTSGARIRIVLGAVAITLGLMDIINPAVSERWKWLRDWMTSIGGEYGYAILLMCVGALFVALALFESISAEVEGK
jgi:hypothetical protein